VLELEGAVALLEGATALLEGAVALLGPPLELLEGATALLGPPSELLEGATALLGPPSELLAGGGGSEVLEGWKFAHPSLPGFLRHSFIKPCSESIRSSWDRYTSSEMSTSSPLPQAASTAKRADKLKKTVKRAYFFIKTPLRQIVHLPIIYIYFYKNGKFYCFF
jgi:hypothetical protein